MKSIRYITLPSFALQPAKALRLAGQDRAPPRVSVMAGLDQLVSIRPRVRVGDRWAVPLLSTTVTVSSDSPLQNHHLFDIEYASPPAQCWSHMANSNGRRDLPVSCVDRPALGGTILARTIALTVPCQSPCGRIGGNTLAILGYSAGRILYGSPKMVPVFVPRWARSQSRTLSSTAARDQGPDAGPPPCALSLPCSRSAFAGCSATRMRASAQ